MPVIEVPFAERRNFISASQMASVIKYYCNEPIDTYASIKMVNSTKRWSQEEFDEFNNIYSEKKGFLFEMGNRFEDDIDQRLFDEHDNKDNKSYKSYNRDGTTLTCEELGISATPDYVLSQEIMGKKTKILMETKFCNPNLTTKMEQYKYQLATQFLILNQQDRERGEVDWSWITRLHFGFKITNQEVKDRLDKCIKKHINKGIDSLREALGELDLQGYKEKKEKTIDVSLDEIKQMKEKILFATKKFREDFANNNLPYITFNEWKMEQEEKKLTMVNDRTDLEKLRTLRASHIFEKSAKEAKDYFKNKYPNQKILGHNCQLSITGIKEITCDKIYWQEKITNAKIYLEKVVKEKQNEYETIKRQCEEEMINLDNNGIVKKIMEGGRATFTVFDD